MRRSSGTTALAGSRQRAPQIQDAIACRVKDGIQKQVLERLVLPAPRQWSGRRAAAGLASPGWPIPARCAHLNGLRKGRGARAGSSSCPKAPAKHACLGAAAAATRVPTAVLCRRVSSRQMGQGPHARGLCRRARTLGEGAGRVEGYVTVEEFESAFARGMDLGSLRVTHLSTRPTTSHRASHEAASRRPDRLASRRRGPEARQRRRSINAEDLVGPSVRGCR